MKSVRLRPYQKKLVVSTLKAFASGKRAILIQLPTGGGKTCIAAELAATHLAEGGTVLVIVHRHELAEAMRAAMPEGVTITTIQGLLASGKYPKASLIILDECHHYVGAPEWSAIAQHYMASKRHVARVVGLTATPCRADGAALGTLFDTLIAGPSIHELQAGGWLVPCEVIAPHERQRGLACTPAEAYARYGEDRSAVIFCRDGQHSEDTAADMGPKAVTVASSHSAERREYAFMAHRYGVSPVLCNVHIATEGYDDPAIEVVILARGCSHAGAYLQMVGRALRPAPGKKLATVIDLCGVWDDFGLPDDNRVFSLEGKAISDGETDTCMRKCSACGRVFRAAQFKARTCPGCGTVTPGKPDPAIERAKLERIASELPARRRREYYEQMLATEKKRGYTNGWAALRYQIRFGIPWTGA